jgi:hypothetical protein
MMHVFGTAASVVRSCALSSIVGGLFLNRSQQLFVVVHGAW